MLLLKYFRLNHIYQFENFSQHLVLANCLPLILKFLDQNICRYFQSKHEITPFSYPRAPLYYVRNSCRYLLRTFYHKYLPSPMELTYFLQINGLR